ncbi:prominin-like protein [Drosophila persimilis]|uniref:prominin-like protein n=1 Tax=Drosophila persimilis TaxID=7234 RepID=UPI000F07EEF4|nr:prominin-like protein [Drosophila persimilis]
MTECIITESKRIRPVANCARNRRERKMEGTLTTATLCAAILLIVLVTRVYESTASANPPDDPPFSYWRKGYSGHGTSHEQMGVLHFPSIEYSRFEPSMNYSKRQNVTKMWVDIVFKFSRTFFDKMFPLDPTMPRGFITDFGNDNMRLGPKVIKDDWAGWLNAFWLMWFWIFFLVVVIILAPFVGVVYFCLCCHRCSLGCPACHSGSNMRKTLLWSTCLIMILPLIAGSMVLAVLSNGMLERGLENTKKTLEMGSIDTCNFLKDVSDHVHHLFVKNYEELSTHLISTIMDAPKHLFRDLSDVAEGNSIAELAGHISYLSFYKTTRALVWLSDETYVGMDYANKLRNGLRAIKRDINYAAVVLCGSFECMKFLQTSGIEFVDTSRCLHLDEWPDAVAMHDDLIEFQKTIGTRHKKWLPRLRVVSQKIKDELERVSPPIIRDIRKARLILAEESRRIEEIIDVVISDIYLATLRASRAFEDLYDKFNETRNFVVQYISVALFVILSVLIVALVIGCLAKRPTGASNEYFTTKMASYILILGMVLIFCAISVMLIVVLFYFVIGGVAYKGACAPLSELKSSALLKNLDSEIDLRTMFSFRNVDVRAANKSSKPIRASSVVKACQGDDYFFTFLQDNKIFDIDDFLRLKLVTVGERKFDQNLDLSKEFILTDADRDVFLVSLEETTLGLFQRQNWMDLVCPRLDRLKLNELGESFTAFGQSLSWSNFAAASVAFQNAHVSLKSIKHKYYPEVQRVFYWVGKNTNWLQYYMAHRNYNLADSMKILRQRIIDVEEFIQNRGTKFISSLGKNLTETIDNQLKDYLRMIIREAKTKIGRCKPLTYIYDRGLDLVCKRMVDPINGYWISVSVAAFLLLPVLFIAHRLQCLFKQHRLIRIRAIRAIRPRVEESDDENPCPYCNAGANRIPGGNVVCIGLDDAETTIFDEQNTIEETLNINDADRKNKVD